jgi:glycosyltransferase involved in cell wall biosynthesis
VTIINKPFFTVVIPLYNKQNHVKKTIETALNQIFQDFEIVVVNDGSKDESPKVVKSINDSRIKIIDQENAGVSVARNRGIKEAKADYIAFLDADDLWLPDFLQTIYDLIYKCPNAGMYATAYKISENGKTKSVKITGLPSIPFKGYIPNYFKCVVLGENLVWTSAVCIPKKVFYAHDISFPEGEKYGEDQYVWGRVALEKKIAYDTRECAIYVQDAENNTVNTTRRLSLPQNSIMSLKNYNSRLYDQRNKKWFDRYIEKYLIGSIIKNKENRNIKNSLKILLTNKFSYKNYLNGLLICFMPYALFDYIKNKKNMK